jgi:predicted nuclease with TOPRIM domain
MDSGLMSFIWAVLLVPIGWLGSAWSKQKDKTDDLAKSNADLVKDTENLQAKFTELNDKLVPLGEDLKQLNETILRAELDLEKRLHGMTLSALQQQQNHTKE